MISAWLSLKRSTSPGGDDDRINRYTDPVQFPVDPGHEIELVRTLFDDDEEVDVAVGSRGAPGRGPEENDFLRPGHPCNPPDDVVQRLLIKHRVLSGKAGHRSERSDAGL